MERDAGASPRETAWPGGLLANPPCLAEVQADKLKGPTALASMRPEATSESLFMTMVFSWTGERFLGRTARNSHVRDAASVYWHVCWLAPIPPHTPLQHTSVACPQRAPEGRQELPSPPPLPLPEDDEEAVHVIWLPPSPPHSPLQQSLLTLQPSPEGRQELPSPPSAPLPEDDEDPEDDDEPEPDDDEPEDEPEPDEEPLGLPTSPPELPPEAQPTVAAVKGAAAMARTARRQLRVMQQPWSIQRARDSRTNVRAVAAPVGSEPGSAAKTRADEGANLVDLSRLLLNMRRPGWQLGTSLPLLRSPRPGRPARLRVARQL